MKKLCISEATFRNYVADEKLDPMQLGKIDYYFASGLAKDLMASKYKKKS